MTHQINIFEELHPNFKFNKKTIRLFESFAGIGSQVTALQRLAKEKGFNIDVVGISEIDKYAIASYNAIHGETKNYGSICDIKKLPSGIDIFTYSFPCQDISLAGKGKGLGRESNTRSGLLWEVERLIKCSDKPQVLLMENVKALINENHRADFVEWIIELEKLGYSNYWQVLNAKNYGIPQNRERVFMVSILGEWNYTFPKPFPLKLRLKDMLEDEVDDKYYLSEKMVNFFHENTIKQKARGNGFEFKPQDGSNPARAVTTNAGSRMDDNFIIIPEATKKGYAEAKDGDGVYINRPHQKRGVVQDGMIPTLKTSSDDVGVVVEGNYSPSKHNASRIVSKEGIAPTVMENHGTVTAVIGGVGEKKSNGGTQWYQQDRIYDDNVAISVTTVCNPYYKNNLKIRKLTPKECWRLMGFTDDQFDKAAQVCSNSQLYKQAGNSIVVDVLYYIFKGLI